MSSSSLRLSLSIVEKQRLSGLEEEVVENASSFSNVLTLSFKLHSRGVRHVGEAASRDANCECRVKAVESQGVFDRTNLGFENASHDRRLRINWIDFHDYIV